MTDIGESAFGNCTSLKTVILGNSVTKIWERAFENCSSLTTVNIPNNVKSFGERAFYGCKLSSINFPNSLTDIGEDAFYGCEFTSVTIPNSVTYIGESAFYACKKITSFVVGDLNPNYCAVDGVLFNKDKTILIQYPVGNTATTYQIPNNVVSIGKQAFASGNNLQSIDIPNSVENIGQGAFFRCENLTSITIPENVTSMGVYAFGYCWGLNFVTCYASIPPQLGVYAFFDIFEIPLYVPAASINAYKAADQWKDFYNIYSIDDLPTSIENVRPDILDVTKLLRNGQILILRGDHTYTLTGQEVK